MNLPALSALALIFLVPLLSCGKSLPKPSAGAPVSAGTLPGEEVRPSETSGRNLLALLLAGENPLWFEFSGQGPRLIGSPGEAETVPFVPWPLARHVRGILPLGEGLFLAVNRDGLLAALALGPRNETAAGEPDTVAPPEPDLALYRIPGDPYWQDYTIAALFPYRNRPALLFYRDDNFSEPAPAPPEPPVLAPAEDLSGFAPLEIPALGDIPFAEGWEADLLRPGADAYWYYRGLRRVNGGREIRYFRTGDLSQRGEDVSAEVFRASQIPVTGTDGENRETSRFLPALPEGFAYTGFAWLGDTLFAAWEEQEDYSIGAAGFMAVKPAR